MKKLSLYVFLGLMWCNVGFAEKYVCVDNENEGLKKTTTIWEKISDEAFQISEVEDKTKNSIEIFYESEKFLALVTGSDVGGGVFISLLLNKEDLTFGGFIISHPFDDFDSTDYNSGKCQMLN